MEPLKGYGNINVCGAHLLLSKCDYLYSKNLRGKYKKNYENNTVITLLATRGRISSVSDKLLKPKF